MGERVIMATPPDDGLLRLHFGRDATEIPLRMTTLFYLMSLAAQNYRFIRYCRHRHMNALQRIVLGLIGGTVATGPMTVAMILLHRRLPPQEQYPLPPREITMKLARQSGLDDQLDASARSAATIASHFGYGAVAGALYTACVEPRRHPTTKGFLFGLLVWIGSYLGWLPAAGILRPATEQPPRRNLLMIGAHLLWGIALGSFVSLLAEEAEGRVREPFSSATMPHADS
jgi:uncharacterized membrane protein YagU involved in acid resistance